MWPLCVAASSGLVLPAASGSAPASIAASPLRVAAHPLLQAPPAVYSPSKDLAGRGAKYYDGRPPELSQSIAQALKEVGKRKICVITGASSGLGLHAVTALTSSYEGYYVIAAVRDTAKMDEAAAEMGIDAKDYKAVKLECASLASVRDFSKELKRLLRGRGLDRLVCNAAVYLPTDPKPRFTDEGYEMSFGVNHLSHFLLLQLLMPDLKKAKDARVCIVGSVTGNKNTVAGSLVKPVADVGDLEGVKAGAGSVMVDGSRSFDGAKAYKDAKARPREGGGGGGRGKAGKPERPLFTNRPGIVFNSMYPGCIAQTQLFREKRDWRGAAYPHLWRREQAIGSYVSQKEAGERLAQTIADPQAAKSGVYWSWNGDAKSIGVGNAGGAGGDLFENSFSGMVQDEANGQLCWDYSMELVKPYLK
ncbi:Protochlorophyllide reductase [Emiliania huxleyi CCMP1516]|uniref:protochlorophyllide reductase n=2 Tax=Emiliania huxleyi TaxID=2903 RepID=A0A0D3K8I1_EMIH1|nr:Protochlorophyllide reductase [Emiliania huxleyi CCMP1516]EOD32066.1 Protochlorophyllide reductase [Emiliania huxleyi CCMP1516]|eukprot:XP_005784495.1 Protochlorophyllide reductase [Emiliania huxleyi CCMP1516]